MNLLFNCLLDIAGFSSLGSYTYYYTSSCSFSYSSSIFYEDCLFNTLGAFFRDFLNNYLKFPNYAKFCLSSFIFASMLLNY